jgi:hypothetical protein
MHAQAQHHVGPAVVKKWRHHGRTRPAAEGPAPVRDSVCARGAAVQLPYVSPRPRAFFLVLFRCFSQSRSPAPVLAGVSLSLTRQPTPGMSSAQLYRWHAARVPERRAVFPALLPCCPCRLPGQTRRPSARNGTLPRPCLRPGWGATPSHFRSSHLPPFLGGYAIELGRWRSQSRPHRSGAACPWHVRGNSTPEAEQRVV